MTKLARTRVHARKGGQSWSMAMSEDGQAPRVMICTISALHPADLHALPGAMCRVQVGAFQGKKVLTSGVVLHVQMSLI